MASGCDRREEGTVDASASAGASSFSAEHSSITRFYEERFLPANAWATLKPHPYLCQRQRQRRIRQTLIESGLGTHERMHQLDVIDVGSGGGANLAWMIELGADPTRCTGIDLVEARVAAARARFAGVRWLSGDFLSTDVGGPFDVVLLLAVLTSVVNPEMKRRIVDKCFSLLRPGGILFFYDLMTRRESAGTKDYKMLTYEEVEGYFGGRRARWFKRDLLRADVAERVMRRAGVTAAEVVQATGLWNMEASFAYVRA